MNYLAHALLSFGNPEILVGNMVADFIKGRARFDYPVGIQAGIDLHRRIDAFTDTHPATIAAKEYFRPFYRLYSAPIVDVIYDHFLANDESIFDDAALLRFSEEVYATLETQYLHLPPRFAAQLPHMKAHNWLYHYKFSDGIGRSLNGLRRRAAYMAPAEKAIELLQEHHEALRQCYLQIAPDVKEYAKKEFDAFQR